MLTTPPRRPAGDTVRLYSFPGSHSGWTAELMLAHKGIAYETVFTPGGRHLYLLPAYGFRGITVPALTIDGRRLQKTRVISRALDVWQPEPRLFPPTRDAAATRCRCPSASRRSTPGSRRACSAATSSTRPTSRLPPSVAVLLSFADLAPHIAVRPAAAHALRVAGEYERRRGPVLPEDWLRPLRSASA